MAHEEIDRLVAERVMGWEHEEIDRGERGKFHAWYTDDYEHGEMPIYYEFVNGDTSWGRMWQPTTDIAQAWQVVERMRALGWDFGMDWDTAIRAMFIQRNGSEFVSSESDSPHIAICIAALKACGHEVTE